MIKCEICGSLIPEQSQQCSKCGSMVKPKEKHFSLEDIANQQLKQNNEIGVGADAPDDDPGTYLPPMGFSDQMQFSDGNLVIEESHTPLPNIESDDPLELLESGSAPLPPIGFSDQMELKDLNMKHYKGGAICPSGLQLQIHFSVSENVDILPVLTSAQTMRERMFRQQQAENTKKVSLQKDTSSSEPVHQETETKRAVSLEKNVSQNVPSQPVHQETETQKTVSLEKNISQNVSQGTESKKTVSLEKTTPVVETSNEYGQTYEFELPNSDYGTSQYHTETAPPENSPSGFGSAQTQNNFSPQNSTMPQQQNSFPSFNSAQPTNNFNPQNSTVPQQQNSFPSFNSAQPTNNFNPQNSTVPQQKNSFPSFNSAQPTNNFNLQNSTMPQQQNSFPSFNSAQQQNNFNNSNFGAIPQSNYNTMNQAAAVRESNNAKILNVVAAVLIVGAILAILAMIVTGHYQFDDASQRRYSGTSAEGTVISTEVNIKDVRWSNLNNGGLAAEDEQGNVYYSNSSGCLCKLDTDGQKNIIYNAASTSTYILYINCYNDRVYFLASLTGTSYTMCSVNQDGKDFKTYAAAQKPYTLFVENGYLYYVDESESNLYRTNIETDEYELVLSVPNESIHSMFIHNGKIYVQHMPETYNGQIDVIDENDFQNVETLFFSYSGKALTPALMTYYGERIYFVDGKNYVLNQMYSSNLDGTDVKGVGSKDVASVSVYGEYIYYLYVAGIIPSSAHSIDGSNYTYNFGRMKTDGSDNRDVSYGGILYYSIAGERIYYLDYDEGKITTMKLDGTDVQNV